MTLEKTLTELFNRGGRIEFGIHDSQRAVVVNRPELRAKVSLTLAGQAGDATTADIASAAEDACKLAYGAAWVGGPRQRRNAAAPEPTNPQPPLPEARNPPEGDGE